MSKRNWLGTSQQWVPANAFDGPGRATVVCYNKHRLPWLSNSNTIVAFISHVDFTLRFFDEATIEDVSHSRRIIWVLPTEKVSICQLAEHLPWPCSEAVYSECTGENLADIFPSMLFTKRITELWNRAGIAHWWLSDRGCVGMSFVSELTGVKSGQKQAVEISDHEFALYKYDLLRCSSLADSAQELRLNIEQLDIDRLYPMLISKHDAITIRMLARLYRRWLFELAVEYEYMLPF